MQHTLGQLSGQDSEPLDFSDDRLAPLLTHVSPPQYGQGIERALHARRLEVYDLSQEVSRCDATPVSGEPAVTETGLMPFGHSQEAPSRPPLNVLLGSWDPLGMP